MEDDDPMNLILHGCKLAKDLELSLPDMANQLQLPKLISKSCEDIVAVFSAANRRISHLSRESAGHCLSPVYFDEQKVETRIWKQLLCTGLHSSLLLPRSAGASMERRHSGNDVTVASVVPTMDVPRERAPSTPSRRHRRRNHLEDRWTVQISAPRIGNMEIPPDDWYTWRKYGQKEILGSKFPRGYFRCTHRKSYRCPAKKQVQRLDSDPSTFEVTYRHLHTCHVSSTAPSVPPPALPQMIPPDTTCAMTGAWIPKALDVCGPSAGVESGSRFAATIGDKAAISARIMG